MTTSKLDRRGRTRIPKAIRDALDLRPDDRLVYRIEGNAVVLSRELAFPDATHDPFRTFHEWDSESDRAHYADL